MVAKLDLSLIFKYCSIADGKPIVGNREGRLFHIHPVPQQQSEPN